MLLCIKPGVMIACIKGHSCRRNACCGCSRVCSCVAAVAGACGQPHANGCGDHLIMPIPEANENDGMNDSVLHCANVCGTQLMPICKCAQGLTQLGGQAAMMMNPLSEPQSQVTANFAVTAGSIHAFAEPLAGQVTDCAACQVVRQCFPPRSLGSSSCLARLPPAAWAGALQDGQLLSRQGFLNDKATTLACMLFLIPRCLQCRGYQ